ncbi:hypothetical protein CDD80_1592 [Ophiocordyceps camponoti-rufipedis]|uniref:Alpha-1,3-glucosyltransferase n=1 Tax=Ophiocordyceps camponoti-rufipedis TaxID=2004952 RepID=A0A2C5ZB05_9HYPO|nr:hypothetical protein CDD80_1592 [Ophiocordyceps camponoti-rufipedis]
MAEPYPTLTQCAVVATAFKILLFPAYKSTDFEVHRNWLAVTHSLPISEWYFDETSPWTLDYPPLFAYWEWLLAHAAALSIFLSPGLLIIDHIHFQYNGFLYGFLVLSLVLARRRSTLLHSAVVFAALLCFKHIYLYLAPAYFVFLLRTYCLSARSIWRPEFLNCVKLAAAVSAVFAASLGPFALMGQLPQLLRRLFPFSRGLCHAYWAPNVWALYSLADRLMIRLAPRLGLSLKTEALQSVTRGLVGDSSFAVLPDVTPRTCFILTLLFQAPPLLRMLVRQTRPTWEDLVGAVTLCGYASFLFGWHVHEKAILLVVIPFSLVALRDRRHLSAFRPLAVAAHVSLFPLLFTPAEFPIKTAYTIFWLVLFLLAFDRLAPASDKPRFFLLDRFSTLYIAGSVPLIAYASLLHHVIFGDALAFLPLMFISCYAAVGVIGSWAGFMVVHLTS